MNIFAPEITVQPMFCFRHNTLRGFILIIILLKSLFSGGAFGHPKYFISKASIRKHTKSQ